MDPFADPFVKAAFAPCGHVAAVACVLGFVGFGSLGLERRGGVSDFIEDGNDFAEEAEGVFFFGDGESLCSALGIAVFLEDLDAQKGGANGVGEAEKGVGSAFLEGDLVACGFGGGDANIRRSDETGGALFAAGVIFVGDVFELRGDLCGDGDAEELAIFEKLDTGSFTDPTGAFVGNPDRVTETIGEVFGS